MNINKIIQQIIINKPSFINCNGGVSKDLPTEITFFDIMQARKILLENNEEKIDKQIYFKPRIMVITHIDIIENLYNTFNFIKAVDYPVKSELMEDQVGIIKDMDFIASSFMPIMSNESMNARDYYPNYFIYSDRLDKIIELRSILP